MAEQVVKSVTEELNCSICFNRFRVPKMLDCIHSFCERCLQDYVKKIGGKNLSCPICRKICALPAGVKGLQTNIYLVNLCEKIDLYEKLKPSNVASKKCESCKRDTTVSAFCVDCKYAICMNCEAHHSLFPALKSHSIEKIDNFKFDQKKLQRIQRSIMVPFCDIHAPEKLRFYCKTCSKLICRECTVVQHPKPDHICVEAPSQFEEVKGILSKLLRESPAELKFVSKYVTDAKSGENEIKIESKALLKNINDRYEQVKSEMESQLDGQLKKAVKVVQKNKISKESNIDDSVKLATNWIKRMESTRETTRKVVQENNMWELLGLSNNLIGSFHTLQNDKKDFQWDVAELKLEMSFTPSEIPDIPFGRCFSTNESRTVVCQYQHNFMKCTFDHDNSILKITKLVCNDIRGDLSIIYNEEKSIQFHLKNQYARLRLIATVSDNYLILGVHKWILIVPLALHSYSTVLKFKDESSIAALAVSNYTLLIVFDDKPKTIYSAHDFMSYGGYEQGVGGTHRVNLVTLVNLDLDSVSRVYTRILEPHTFQYNIKYMNMLNSGVILVTNDNFEQLVRYHIDSKTQDVVDLKAPPSIKNAKKVSILSINADRHTAYRGYYHHGQIEDSINFTSFILWGGQSNDSIGFRDMGQRLFITRYESSSQKHTNIWQMSADMGRPRACYWDQNYNVLIVCDTSGKITTLSDATVNTYTEK